MPTLTRFSALAAAPVLQETLELLEWPRLCEHLASFASTKPGRRAALGTALPEDLATSRLWLARTIELAGLDGITEGGLSFQGVHDLESVLLRCSKGGTADGEELLRVADTLAAARRLRRQVDDPDLRPLCTDLFSAVATFPELEQRLKFSLEEGGRVADRASAALSGLRLQWQSLRQQRRDRLQEVLRRWSAQFATSHCLTTSIAPSKCVPAMRVPFTPGLLEELSGRSSRGLR